MNNEIQLINDGDGLAVIGESATVERFLEAEGLASQAVDLPRASKIFAAGGALAQAGSEISASSGRWLKLTEESAQKVKEFGLMPKKDSNLQHVMIGEPGAVKSWLQVAKGPSTLAQNPAVLAGVAGVMAQMAMRQTMDEITDYLDTINEKVDDVLRAQKDAVLSRVIGVGFVLDEAMAVREAKGRVGEITWSKLQAAPATIAETQAYALRQLDALAEKLEGNKVGDLAEVAKDAESKAQEWLAVLARCFQLQDAVAVIELDRVLDASPDELDGHRLGLRNARQDRMELIERTTERLLIRMDAAARLANAKVLRYPTKSPAIVRSSNQVSGVVGEFHQRLGIVSGQQARDARRWAEAATEVKDKALEKGAERVEAAKRLRGETAERAKAARGMLAERIPDRVRRRRSGPELVEGD